MKTAIITFPGTNRERDMAYALERAMGKKPDMVWHKEQDLSQYEFLILAGGFSFGDYLRSGAIAAHSPIMQSVRKAADRGIFILGVCNGFQILTEAGLLDGALLRNKYQKFMCKTHNLRIELDGAQSPFLTHYKVKQVISLPMANIDGNYQISQDGLKRLQDEDRIALRYCDAEGKIAEDQHSNPNGSIDNIAGIINKTGRVLGMMPHPENAALEEMGSAIGLGFFTSILEGAA